MHGWSLINMKNFLRILKNPRFWKKQYPTNETVECFVRTLIEHKDEVEILRKSDMRIYLQFKNHVYGLWIAGSPECYLHSIVECKTDPMTKEFNLHYHINSFDDGQPSLITMLDFYETFDKKQAEDKVKFLKEVLDNGHD